MHTIFHRSLVAFIIGPVFFVASSYGISWSLPALLYLSLPRWRAYPVDSPPLSPPHSSSSTQKNRWRPYSPAIVVVYVFPSVYNCLLPHLKMAGGRWNAGYVCVNVKTTSWLYCFQHYWKEQRYHLKNNKQATGSNGVNNGCNGWKLLICNKCRTVE